MRITIDIRSLLEPYMSGVGEYTYNVLNRILKTDHESQYHLFYNTRHSVKTKPPVFDYPNTKVFGYQYPNRWFNLSLRYFGWPRLEKLSGNPDVMWFPNFGFMNFASKWRAFVPRFRSGLRQSKCVHPNIFSIPYVLTVHDLAFERYPEFFTRTHRLWHKMIDCKKMALGAKKIIAVSESTKNDLIELYGVDSKKIEVIYEGVDIANLHPPRLGEAGEFSTNIFKLEFVKQKYKLPEKFILFLGTIEPRKNIEAIIRAFDKVVNDQWSMFNEHHLVLAGGKGWRNEDIYRVWKQAKNKDKIKFIGYVDKEDKPALYSLAEIFVFPSIYEGFGLPPLEAMACGVPVIASNCSSLPEIVGDAGLLVNPYNINELADAIREMLASESLRNDFIEKGFEQAKKFSWDICAEKTLNILQQI